MNKCLWRERRLSCPRGLWKAKPSTPKPKESSYHVTGDGQEHPIAFFMAVPDSISAKRSFQTEGIKAYPPA